MKLLNIKQNKRASENSKILRIFEFFRRDFLKDRKSGFSLVEMLVAIGIFMTIMTIAVTSLISIMGANKKAQAIKSTVDSVTFALEYVSRDMRIGTNYTCGTPDVIGKSDCIGGSNSVKYVNSSNEPIQYTFSTTTTGTSRLTKTKLPPNCSGTDCTVDLISADSDVHIDNFTFYVIGSDHELDATQANRTQPRVIVTASGFITAKGSANTTFNLQTNISQRARR